MCLWNATSTKPMTGWKIMYRRKEEGWEEREGYYSPLFGFGEYDIEEIYIASYLSTRKSYLSTRKYNDSVGFHFYTRLKDAIEVSKLLVTSSSHYWRKEHSRLFIVKCNFWGLLANGFDNSLCESRHIKAKKAAVMQIVKEVRELHLNEN